MKRIFIAGATGYLGKHLTKACAQHDWHTMALTRTNRANETLRQLGGEPIFAQATKMETLTGLMKDVDVVISALGITKQKDGLTYMDVDYQANVNLLNEAMRAGVKHFIYVSVFEGESLKHHSEMVRAKEKFVAHLTQANIQHSIVRPTGFFSDMGEYMTMAKQGRAWVIGSGQQQINPIDGADLALCCLEVIEHKRDNIPVGGPQILTFTDIAMLAFESLNKKPKISHFPQWLTGITAKVIPRVTPQTVYGPIEMFLTASTMDMVAPQYGTRRLKDYFQTLH